MNPTYVSFSIYTCVLLISRYCQRLNEYMNLNPSSLITFLLFCHCFTGEIINHESSGSICSFQFHVGNTAQTLIHTQFIRNAELKQSHSAPTVLH